jgi:cytochrome oxidase assembly protein ShyY1
MARLSFLRRPRWVLFTATAVVAVVVMIGLGFWQLGRLHVRRALNAKIIARSTATAVPLESIVTPTSTEGDLDRVRYDVVTLTGSFDASRTHVIPSRTQAEGPGGWVVTPLRVGAHDVLVLRGFEKLSPDGSLPARPSPSGTVQVTGYVMQLSHYHPIAKKDFTDLRAADPATLPAVVQVATIEPADDPSLEVVPLPPLDEGPYLGYAVQWFLFASVGVAGWFLIVRRQVQRGAAVA